MVGGNMRAPHTPTLFGAVVLVIVGLLSYHFLIHKRR